MNQPNHSPGNPTEPDVDALTYAAASLEDVRRNIEAAQSATVTALVWLRILIARHNDGEGADDTTD